MELDITKVSFSKNKNYTMKNEITFNLNLFENMIFDENEMVELVTNNCKKICIITYKRYDTEKTAYLSRSLKKYIDGDKVTISRIPHVNLNKYYTSKIENIKDEVVEISKDIIDNIKDGKNLNGVIFLNKLNGYMLNVPINKIQVNVKTNNKVRLSIKHRRLLDIELPTYINQIYIDKYSNILDKYYNSEFTNVQYDNYYETVQWFKNSISEHNIDSFSVYPLYETKKKYNIIESLTSRVNSTKISLLSFFIGQRQITLRVIRPYPIDESENSIRVSQTAMKLLGLEETDTVIIRNGNNQCKARVLCIDEPSIIFNENRIKSDEELSILVGIPSYMRIELGLEYINSNVSIERDLSYFFRKHLNKQIMTIIGLMISISVLQKFSNIILRTVLIFVLVILFIYHFLKYVKKYQTSNLNYRNGNCYGKRRLQNY
ncbi:hypothetical protein [Clostridium sp. DL1XJH146]